MSPQCAFRSCCNASSSFPYWASAGHTSRNSADDSAHDRANRTGYAADRSTCYRASRLLRDWGNLDFFGRLRTFFLFWVWMIRHKLWLRHSLVLASYISQARVGIAVTKLKIRWTIRGSCPFESNHRDLSERRSCACLRGRFSGEQAS